MTEISQELLKDVVTYFPETGCFTWKVSKRYGIKNGDEAGCIRVLGKSGKKYHLIRINNKDYLAHRLAFLYMNGVMPPDQVDHIDGNGTNNKFINLRMVTSKINGLNQRIHSNNTTGVSGVSPQKTKYISYINKDGKRKHLGCFVNLWDAICARKSAEYSLGYHINHGSLRPL